MEVQKIDQNLLRRMFMAGAHRLRANKEWINELNVFPVPDGDTGTNMTMTIMSAVKEVDSLGDDPDMATLCKAISSGSLRGARGNSGVILSQLLRGFCKVAKQEESLDVKTLADCFEKAVDTAYKAVMKPKEGTILTVARQTAEKARALADEGSVTMEAFLDGVIEAAKVSLEHTPELLPVLKQAGVVDSGGQGLLEALRGAVEGFRGKEVSFEEEEAQAPAASREEAAKERAAAQIRYGYCTEFVILTDPEGSFTPRMEKEFKSFLGSIGDSIVCVAEGSAVKVHVHTNDPGLVIQRGLLYGQLTDLKIDNMRLEHKETLFTVGEKEAPKEEMPHKDTAFVTVSVGEGLTEIFAGLGVDEIISGGQTMNPSTEDILNAIERINADTIFVLPNNKNIIMAANQAASMTKDKKVIVIPTKTIPQGITAAINFIADSDPEVNRENMLQEVANVRSGEVTYAVRDTEIDGKEIHQGDFMGIGDEGILAVNTDLQDCTLETLAGMVDEETSLISVYYGSDVTEDVAQQLGEQIREKFPQCELELQFGGQPVYAYLLSAER